MLDLDWLRVSLECDEDTVRMLLELYARRGAELMIAMAAAVDAADTDALGLHAHSLKGISGTIGAQRIHSLLRDDPTQLVSIFPRVEQAFDELREVIALQLAR